MVKKFICLLFKSFIKYVYTFIYRISIKQQNVSCDSLKLNIVYKNFIVIHSFISEEDSLFHK